MQLTYKHRVFFIILVLPWDLFFLKKAAGNHPKKRRRRAGTPGLENRRAGTPDPRGRRAGTPDLRGRSPSPEPSDTDVSSIRKSSPVLAPITERRSSDDTTCRRCGQEQATKEALRLHDCSSKFGPIAEDSLRQRRSRPASYKEDSPQPAKKPRMGTGSSSRLSASGPRQRSTSSSRSSSSFESTVPTLSEPRQYPSTEAITQQSAKNQPSTDEPTHTPSGLNTYVHFVHHCFGSVSF